MSTTTTKPHRLALVPRDGFFAKDGRGWSTSARTHVVDWPWPTTIRGALTTASGKLVEPVDEIFRREQWASHQATVNLGRMVALRRPHCAAWSREHRMWLVPADALWLESEERVLRLEPSQPETPTLGRAAPRDWGEGFEAAREALWVPQNVGTNAKPLGAPRWWPEKAFIDWLCAEPVANDPKLEPQKQWPSPEKRLQVHIGVRPDTFTSDEGILYLHDVVETLERNSEWAIGVEADWPSPIGSAEARVPGMVRLGSDGRLARAEVLTEIEDVFAESSMLISAFAEKKPRGLRLVVVTPACFQCGWLPDGFDSKTVTGAFQGTLPGISGELVLRAALVPRPMHVSGWDMANHRAKGGAARSTSRLAPPGAVYFFQRTDKAEFAVDDAKALWLAALGNRTDEGFGRVVPGIWEPKDTK